MRKLIALIILSLAMLLPLATMAKPVYAQEDWVTTTYDDSSYSDYYSDYSDLTDEEVQAGFLAGTAALLFSGVMAVFSIIIGVGSYVYCSLALMKLAKRMNHENPWYAWIPILNMVLLFQLGDKNPVLLLLLLIPGIGAVIVGVISIIAMMNICEKRGYDKALGLLMLIPVANYVLLGILAWGKKEPTPAVQK